MMGKKYDSVEALILDTCGPEGLLEFSKFKQETKIVTLLMVNRCFLGIDYEDAAERLGWTVEKIMEVESSKDFDCNIRDLVEYANLVGMQLKVTLNPKGTEQ